MIAPMSKPILFKVAGPEKGMPLQALLTQRLKISRNLAKRLLDTRQVFVNKQRIWMARHVVQTGDMIEVQADIEQQEEAVPRCEIIWQDDFYIIINKPSGWLANGPGSIEEKLEKELGRPVYAVHRLDRDTSGCMLLSFLKDDMEMMIPVFQRREVKKIYEGLVIGKFPADLTVIDRTVAGEEAVTLVKVLRQARSATRVEFTLVTGRTHQIRRHLNAYKLYLAGEKNYGNTTLEYPVLRTVKRHMLHAKILGFPHPKTGKMVEVKSALPEDYRKLAKEIGV